jgi:single-strand DNA-binding protein
MTLPRINGEAGVYADPEIRFAQSGKAVATVKCVFKKRVRDSNGTWTDGDPCFLDVTVFGTMAENVVETITKGATVVIDGVLEQQHWVDKDSGEKRSKFAIVADSIGPSCKWNGWEKREGEPKGSADAPQEEAPPF